MNGLRPPSHDVLEMMNRFLPLNPATGKSVQQKDSFRNDNDNDVCISYCIE